MLDKYLDCARELLEKLLNMRVIMILIVVGALETVIKGFEKRKKQIEDLKNDWDNLDDSAVKYQLDYLEVSWRP